ncbi:MAG TPA: hypothetical protein VGX48_17740 [Pyrinomonadaceae bacterium]|jgi:hypothetical protein|nr:hypothetical protein [Pyrinomonadaceae bacterium]
MAGRARQIFKTAGGAVSHFVTTRPMSALLVAVTLGALASVAWQFAGGVVSGARSAITSNQVQATEAQSHEAQVQAGAAIASANETAVERKVNDQVRERTIKPAVEQTAREAAAAKERVKGARSNYEKATNTNALRRGDDLGALHRRNCADLALLYPGERFARCQ